MNQTQKDPLIEELYSAAQAGDVETVRRLLAAGANPNARSRNGKSAFMAAMVYGQFEVLRALLENGSRPSASEVSHGFGFGCGVGASDSKAPLMKLLLEYGLAPNVDRSREDGSTLLMGMLGHCDALELVPLLLDHGADINARDAEGCTPFMYASDLYFDENIRLLHERGADVDARDNLGRTALMKTLFIHEDDWEKLTDRHRPIGDFEWDEDIEWRNACYTRRMQVLLDCGVDVNVIAPCGWNALLLSLAFGNAPSARLLLKHGASLAGVRRKTIRRAQHFMKWHDYTEEIGLLAELTDENVPEDA